LRRSVVDNVNNDGNEGDAGASGGAGTGELEGVVFNSTASGDIFRVGGQESHVGILGATYAARGFICHGSGSFRLNFEVRVNGRVLSAQRFSGE
jgi:hypothetical protein